MAKAKRNPVIGELTGKIKDLQFAQYEDKQVVRGSYKRKPTTKWTDPQVQSQSKFGKSTQYAREVLADPARKAEYEAAKKTKHRSEWNLAIADAQNAPAILDVDLDSYHGQPGQLIFIQAVDDIKVVSVSVTIHGAAGALLEMGSAALNTVKHRWIYVAQTVVPAPESAVVITVTAVDLPGNQTQKQVDRILRRNA
jgi:hypothetical protein